MVVAWRFDNYEERSKKWRNKGKRRQGRMIMQFINKCYR